MFFEIHGLFSESELAELLRIAGEARFVDGRISNPANTAKNNLQLVDQNAYGRSAKIMADALFRREEFVEFAFPKVIAPPLITKYSVGMNYGPHADAAFIPLGNRPLRTDLSATIFLAEPDSYEGGELSVQLGSRTVAFKGRPGSAVVYPSNTMHQVLPVSKGERVVGITFIESQVADPVRRDLLHELNEVAALEGLKMEQENFSRLQRVQMTLKRMWSAPA